MMKWAKNLFITLFAVFSFALNAQNNNSYKSMIIGDGNYNKWIASNSTCAGCGSFFAMVVNNPKPIKGYYYYDIYLWSNSFYTNSYAANTYIKQISVYTIDPEGVQYFIFKMPYVVVAPKSDMFNGYFYLGYVYSPSAIQDIKISWLKASAW